MSARTDLLCLRCGGKLWVLYRKGNLVERCTDCDGMWFDAGEISPILGIHRPLAGRASGKLTELRCLRCPADEDRRLVEIAYPSTRVPVDVCPGCHGTWIDGGELDALREAFRPITGDERPTPAEIRAAAAKIEAAEAAAKAEGRCPKCDGRLWHARRSGIVVERCLGCEGMWFDAGELVRELCVVRKIDLRDGAPTEIVCFKCSTAPRLVRIDYPGTGVAVDVCPECRGLWLDAGELDALKDAVAGLVGRADAPLAGRSASMLALD